MNEQPKKVYTIDDNVKAITFSLKDIVKQIQESNRLLHDLVQMNTTKNSDEKDCPF